MNQPDERRTSGSPEDNRYDPTVAKVERVSVEVFRSRLAALAKKQGGAEADNASGEGASQVSFDDMVVTRHGKPFLVAVDLDTYRQFREAVGKPTDL